MAPNFENCGEVKLDYHLKTQVLCNFKFRRRLVLKAAETAQEKSFPFEKKSFCRLHFFLGGSFFLARPRNF